METFSHSAETAWSKSLSPSDRSLFLSHLVHYLTIAMRLLAHDQEGHEIGLDRVRAINELQHIISRYLTELQTGGENQRWLEVIAKGFSSQQDSALQDQLSQSWFSARASIEAR